MYEQIPESRKEEIREVTLTPDSLYAVLFARQRERAQAIQDRARCALGVQAETDITQVPQPTRTELLYAMGALRDAIAKDLPWPE